MRLCLVSREYPPLTEYTGGIGRQFSALARELARQGHEVHVATITDGSSHYGFVDGVHVHLLREARLDGPLSESRVMVRRAVDVDRLLDKAGPWDVVYAAEWRGEAVRYALRRRRAPVVTNLASSLAKVHEVSRAGNGRSARARSAIQHAIERSQTKQSDAIVAPSSAILEWAREMWQVDRIPSQVLPNMIDVERTRRLAHGDLPDGFPLGEPTIVYFGRLERVKGVDVLVRAMTELWERGHTTRLVLIGHDTSWGTAESMVTRLQRTAGAHAGLLTFVENQDSATLFPALAAAAIVVLPSRWESFSLAALESMAVGRPTIVTSVGGVVEFVEDGHHGLVVPPDDHVALAHAIERLLGDGGLRDRLVAGAARRAEDFDVSAVTRRHADYFAHVAGAHSG